MGSVTKKFISKKTSPSPLSSPSRGEDGLKSAPPLRGGDSLSSSPPLRGGDEGEGDFCSFTFGLISKKVESSRKIFLTPLRSVPRIRQHQNLSINIRHGMLSGKSDNMTNGILVTSDNTIESKYLRQKSFFLSAW